MDKVSSLCVFLDLAFPQCVLLCLSISQFVINAQLSQKCVLQSHPPILEAPLKTFLYQSILPQTCSTALIWFVPNMSTHMTVKILFIWEGFLTMSASIRFLPWMNHYMLVKITLFYNFFSHSLHWYGFSPVWGLICQSRLILFNKVLSQ